MLNLRGDGFESIRQPSRRSFLITMPGAAALLGYARSALDADAGADASQLFEPTIWYSIDPTGVVTINITRAENGATRGHGTRPHRSR
jgi:hypothetical protein